MELAPYDDNQPPLTDEYLQEHTIGPLTPLAGPVCIHDYDLEWPRLFQLEAERIQCALIDQALRVEHVGSTSVPGLPAKPTLDILLVVADSANEPAYLPALENAGYKLQIREPGWYEHRMLKGPSTDLNLHVFSTDCVEVDRMLAFRDWLRSHAADRELYARVKRELAQKEWKYMQNYADAKTVVIEAIMSRWTPTRLK